MPDLYLARWLTGPLAFLVAGVIDAVAYGLISARRALAGAAPRPGRASTIRGR
jgi:hypothetical protein